jgi:hypothetical protein
MLSTITAAETQFRHEYDSRQREINLLASIRERRALESATAPRVAAPRTRPAAARVSTSSAAGWARPIGIASSSAACAA